MYIKLTYNGIVGKEQAKLDIYKYIQKEQPFGYISKPGYNANQGTPKEVFDKETAKKAMFKFYFENKIGKEIAKELGTEDAPKVGFANGNTLTMLGFGIREANKTEGVTRDTQRGVLKGKVSAEEAQQMIDEVIEFVY